MLAARRPNSTTAASRTSSTTPSGCVQQRCPEWTDHNVSDPGVTLIETFAWMTDQLLYRLNRVPDRNYVKFLELLGVHALPADRGPRRPTFWLSAPQAGRPCGSRRHAGRHGPHRDGRGRSCSRPTTSCRSSPAVARARGFHRAPDGEPRSRPTAAGRPAFALLRRRSRGPDDAVLFGLTDAVAVVRRRAPARLRDRGRRRRPARSAAGVGGVDGDGWAECEVERDDTGGLNRRRRRRPPRAAQARASVLGGERAGWLRCRVARGEPRASRSTAPPRGSRRCGASPSAAPSRPCTPRSSSDEVLGLSEGVPGQRFLLARRPVVPVGEPPRRSRCRRQRLGGVAPRSTTFADSASATRHFRLDRVAGEIVFGPAVREADGTLRQLRRGAAEGRGAADARRTAPAAGRAATSPRRRTEGAAQADPVRRTGREPAAAHRRRRRRGRRRTPRCAGRSRCAPATARSPPRTTSSSPTRRRPRWPGCAACRPRTRRMPAPCGLLVVPAADGDRRARCASSSSGPARSCSTRSRGYLDERR